jgi:hypothetical protein
MANTRPKVEDEGLKISEALISLPFFHEKMKQTQMAKI